MKKYNITLFLLIRLDTAELAGKSEVAATRLRYEQQIKNLHTEMSSIQVH